MSEEISASSDTARTSRTASADPTALPWWRSAVIYQVYPRSFQDSDGDGVGDLAGIRSRLDYLVELGVDAVWLSPIYPSPMADFGYDVSDYTGVDPLFGTLADFDALLERAHELGLKVLLDFVPSHSSEEHPWFVASRSSRDDPKRDWYVWSDPAPEGGPPNNWVSEFGGSAWELDEASGQYYLHHFLVAQPSLNWRHPDVRAAMLDAMRFWFERGIDGFRVDAFHLLVADEALRDNPENPDADAWVSPARRLLGTHTAHQPETHAAGVAMRELADRYSPERVLLVETHANLEELALYHGPELNAFHLPFNFDLLTREWSAHAIAAFVDAYEASLPAGAWPNWVLGNHDISRVASRIGPAQVPVAAMLLLTLRGTPIIYQGDELGLEDVPVAAGDVQDPWELNVPGLGLGRDPVRTPMPWVSGEGGGFTTGKPWLPFGRERDERNVALQAARTDSVLGLYKRLLRLRRDVRALTVGAYRLLGSDENVLVYERGADEGRVVVALNFSDERRDLEAIPAGATLLLSSSSQRGGTRTVPSRLEPNEGVVLALASG